MTEPFVGLLAELTHRCPLRCPYCSNPMALVRGRDELATEAWVAIFRQAAEGGALQVHLSGGEPAARSDLVELVRAAHEAGLYTNLITGGIGLDPERLPALAQAGLDHVQLSVQSTREARATAIGGLSGALATKQRVAWAVTESGLPLTINAVLHRANTDEIEALADLAERWGARRLELAHAQIVGWAWTNREALVPTEREMQRAETAVARVAGRAAGPVLTYVAADTHAGRPKACMDGWGARFVVVGPDGAILPCHGASELPLAFPRAPEVSLAEAWQSEPFERFRSAAALAEPCRSCPEHAVDRGGCRCQAFAATGSVTASDPTCDRATGHGAIVALRAKRAREGWRPRRPQTRPAERRS